MNGRRQLGERNRTDFIAIKFRCRLNNNLLLPFPTPLSCCRSRSLGFIYQCQATTLMHKCIHFKLIFILILIMRNIIKLIMTSWLSEKCEMVGRQFGSIVDCNLSFNNCSYISYLLMGHQNKVIKCLDCRLWRNIGIKLQGIINNLPLFCCSLLSSPNTPKGEGR